MSDRLPPTCKGPAVSGDQYLGCGYYNNCVTANDKELPIALDGVGNSAWQCYVGEGCTSPHEQEHVRDYLELFMEG